MSESQGHEQALWLYTSMLLDSLERMLDLPGPRYLFVSGGSGRETISLLSDSGLENSYSVKRQKGRDLGARLWNAYCEVGHKVGAVFLGADSPTVPLAYVRRARQELKRTPVVLGPSKDGGYYLIGVSKSLPELFRDIPWGTSEVLADTLARIRNRDYLLLPRWYDLDVSDDLRRVRNDLRLLPSSVCPRLRILLGLKRSYANWHLNP